MISGVLFDHLTHETGQIPEQAHEGYARCTINVSQNWNVCTLCHSWLLYRTI